MGAMNLANSLRPSATPAQTKAGHPMACPARMAPQRCAAPLPGSQPGTTHHAWGCIPPPRPMRSMATASTSAQGEGSSASPSPAPKQPGFLGRIFKALQDFGIGGRSIQEGGVGLFLLAGTAFGVALVSWAQGSVLRKGKPYEATLEFPLACGITVGTPVRIRGVQVGSVVNVKPSLDRVDVQVEVNDQSSIIPLNSLVEANQSGLIAEPLVDITPKMPLPKWAAGPLDPDCAAEGAILCSGGRLRGQQGVALDDLVYIMTKMARQMDSEGMDKVFGAVESLSNAVEEAKPLLAEAQELLAAVTPLLTELREGGLVANVESLTRTASDAAADIQRLQTAVLTEDNVRALRQAVLTLCKTLEHVESISSDVSVLSRDSSVQRNLKTLVQALSRLVDE